MSPEVWLSVGISYLAVSILLYIIARYSSRGFATLQGIQKLIFFALKIIFFFIFLRLSPSEQMYPEVISLLENKESIINIILIIFKNETKLTFLNSFWFSLAALAGQGSEVIPR